MDALAFELVLVIERLLETAAADHPLDDIWTKKERATARRDAAEAIERARATDIAGYGFEAPADKQTFAEHEANARLMTAAPPLYETAKAVIEAVFNPATSPDEEREAWDRLRAALALARGESNG